MNRKWTSALALVIFVSGMGGCNMGPEMETETETGMEHAKRSDAVVEFSDSRASSVCYGLRHYYEMTCVNGERQFADQPVGIFEKWCPDAEGNRAEYMWGDETNCYRDFRTYNCDDPMQSCGEMEFTCPTCFFPRRPIFNPPGEFAP